MTHAAPADFACLDVDDNPVFVMPSGHCENCGTDHHITIAVRDSDVDDDVEIFRREHCRELIDLHPADAIRLARYLLDWATDMLDGDHDGGEEDSS